MTQDPRNLVYIVRPKNQDTERGIWDTYDRLDPTYKTNISYLT